MYKFLIFFLISSFLFAQDTISLGGVIVKKDIDVIPILKKVKKNIKKNYKTNNSLFIDSNFLSKKNEDSILYFDGVINFNPDYKNKVIFDSNLCFERERKVNVDQLTYWFPYDAGKSYDYFPNPPYNKGIPFFFGRILSFIGIENIPIFKNLKNFTYSSSFLEKKTKLKIDFYSNNLKYPYKGHLIIDNNTYAVLEFYYTNYDDFILNEWNIVNFKRRKDLETPYLIKKIEISSKYSKEDEVEKYSLSSLHTSVSFEEEKNNNIKYNSFSNVKSVTPSLNCENKLFNLWYLGLFSDEKK